LFAIIILLGYKCLCNLLRIVVGIHNSVIVTSTHPFSPAAP
jgi:hypothetical protein